MHTWNLFYINLNLPQFLDYSLIYRDLNHLDKCLMQRTLVCQYQGVQSMGTLNHTTEPRD